VFGRGNLTDMSLTTTAILNDTKKEIDSLLKEEDVETFIIHVQGCCQI
jgi:hypothetical protein